MTNVQHNQDFLDSASAEIDELATDGATVAVDPDIAEHMGAFEETALSDDEAQLSLLDLDPDSHEVLEEGDDQ